MGVSSVHGVGASMIARRYGLDNVGGQPQRDQQKVADDEATKVGEVKAAESSQAAPAADTVVSQGSTNKVDMYL